MDLLGNRRQADVSDQISGDRRQDRRYPIELELKYKLIRRRRILETGVGRTIDLSSGGILFEAERPLPVGLNVELSITWPVLLHNIAPMRLLVAGRIIRSNRNRIALRSTQHEFRTQGTSAPLLHAQDGGSSGRAATPLYGGRAGSAAGKP